MSTYQSVISVGTILLQQYIKCNILRRLSSYSRPEAIKGESMSWDGNLWQLHYPSNMRGLDEAFFSASMARYSFWALILRPFLKQPHMLMDNLTWSWAGRQIHICFNYYSQLLKLYKIFPFLKLFGGLFSHSHTHSCSHKFMR